jgi:hypothetical protein
MAPEAAGVALCFRGPARTEWLHGFSAGELPDGAGPVARTSVSFRFFSDVKDAPPYDTKNDI